MRGARYFSSQPFITDKSEIKHSEFPKVPKRGSYKPILEQGKTYYWCACGRSENQPFCDGSHKGTSFKPLKFVMEQETRKKSVCGCKLNLDENGPFCDRSHKVIDFDNLETKYKPGFHQSEEWKRDFPTDLYKPGEREKH